MLAKNPCFSWCMLLAAYSTCQLANIPLGCTGVLPMADDHWVIQPHMFQPVPIPVEVTFP